MLHSMLHSGVYFSFGASYRQYPSARCVTRSGRYSLLGLAIKEGSFGEGIDLVGEQLIGAVVIGVGVPQVCLESDLIKHYFDRQNVSGFAYAYQYPGFNRVL